MSNSSLQPITLYGSNISYFTGKLEMYFRIRQIPYQFVTATMRLLNGDIVRNTGISQMPALQLGDGRWMTDTTAIIDWFEVNHAGPTITPTDPVQRFFSRLLEDYTDEWLWRPAMHYRWYGDEGAMQLSRHIVDELMADIPLPGALKRFFMRQRQRGGYTRGDGITEQNRLAVEAIYHRNLAALEEILQQRPFLLGQHPSLADIGFMGSMFRHFSQDPAPGEIMRQTAPAVAEWVARLWNYRADESQGNWLSGIPEDWGFWLDDIATSYLPYLNASAVAVTAGKKRLDCDVAGAQYRGAHASRYRLHCLQQLRNDYNKAPETAQTEIRSRLEAHHCWQPLWKIADLDSEYDSAKPPPFHGQAKMVK
jgi:glutathione S-transferase